MGYTSPDKISLTIGSTSANPLASTTYYFGWTVATMNTTADSKKTPMPSKGVIRSCALYIFCAVGSNDATTLYIRKNNTTDYVVSAALDFSVAKQIITNTSLNIPVEVGDYIEFKLVTPAWAAAPTGVINWGSIVLETT